VQDVHFRSIDEFLNYLPADERKIVDRLRAIVQETVPEADERLSYNVPYYRRHAHICYIWPGSVAWAGKTKQGVQLGFTQGAHMDDPRGYLDCGGRKQVCMRVYRDAGEIEPDIVRELLAEAVRVDEERQAARRRH
jgi:hypothetical protein